MKNEQNQPTVLGADCVIRGEMSLDGDAVIMGRFTGTLRVGGLLDLSSGAEAQGTIIAGAVRLGGSAEADVVAEHGIELAAGSKLGGRLFATRLSIDEGAAFEGDINVGPRAMQAAEDAMKHPAEPKVIDDAPSLRFPADPEARNPSVISNILNHRRAKLMSAAQTLNQSPAV